MSFCIAIITRMVELSIMIDPDIKKIAKCLKKLSVRCWISLLVKFPETVIMVLIPNVKKVIPTARSVAPKATNDV